MGNQGVKSNSPPRVIHGQLLHLGFLTVAGILLILYSDPGPGFWSGLPVSFWFWLAVSIPVIHQIYVWVCWRLALRQRFTDIEWNSGRCFRLYLIGFFVLFISRFLSLLVLAVADYQSLELSVDFRWAVATPLMLIVGYGFFSIKKYFGFERAAGIDHFDPGYSSKPLVRNGIFKWSPNAMYLFVLQGTWLFGILAGSRLAMIVAGFQSIYIWVHYVSTEKPDMKHIYG